MVGPSGRVLTICLHFGQAHAEATKTQRVPALISPSQILECHLSWINYPLELGQGTQFSLAKVSKRVLGQTDMKYQQPKVTLLPSSAFSGAHLTPREVTAGYFYFLVTICR